MNGINKLILGDCLEVLKTLESETLDLIYIDPPFFSNRTYEVIWGDKGEIRSFEDRFSGGIDHYIAWLKDRVQEMYRILKPTGSIFVHCDWHANAYIRVYILDKIFGSENFRNEIIWKRGAPKSNAKQGSKKFGNSIDTLFFYTKSNTYTFNHQFTPYNEEEKKAKFKYADAKGRFCLHPLDGPGGAAKGNPFYEFLGIKRHWRYSEENMQKLLAEDKIYQAKEGNVPTKKFYEWEAKGLELQNYWDDIINIRSFNQERIGYPTQKPEALLERIIKTATNEGDTVLDGFVGGGTTVAVADRLGRNWIGIDQSVQAIKVTEFRLNKQQSLFSKPFTVQLHKYDYDTLRYKDAFEFEAWIVGQFGGIPNAKQRGDLGIDGRTRDNQPIQVKRSDNIGRNVIDNFHAAVMRYDKALYEKNKENNNPIGFIIAFSFGKGAIQEVARLKNEENLVIKLLTVEEIVPIAKKPSLQVVINDLGASKNLREIELIARGESEVGIEFYAWDFAYNEQQFLPTVLLDRVGKQLVKFKAGEHRVAVKVVDNAGLESIEVIKLKINGAVART